MPEQLVDERRKEEALVPIVELRGIRKSFGGIAALDGVSLEVAPGEVHALFGHNGAGKSTLIKTLAGAVTPDEGSVLVDGREIDVHSPKGALDAGIRVVYQELSLFGELTVAENLIAPDFRATLVNRSAVVKQARHHLATMGLDIDPNAAVENLPIGEQQMVEIGRALFSGARVVVLDEPTSALSPSETATLFGFVRQMADRGISFILISHFLDEILENAQRVTILRSGRVIDTLNVVEVTAKELVTLALGAEHEVLVGTYEDVARRLPPPRVGPVVARAAGLAVGSAVSGVDFEIGEGEIVAFYGELGCGNETIGEALFGLRRPEAGELTVLGRSVAGRNATKMRDLGVGYVPADRRAALALEQPVYRNVTLAALEKVCPWLLNRVRERRVTDSMIERLGIIGAEAGKQIGNLSGGNQQKALIARWLVDLPKLLVLAEPTRGMDVGAKSDVLRAIETVRDDGSSVVVITNEPETAVAVADRILTMRRGAIIGEFAGTSVSARDLVEAVA